MAADTSSPAAATTAVVGPAATACAALNPEPILDRSEAAEATDSGTGTTNDIATPVRASNTSLNQKKVESIAECTHMLLRQSSVGQTFTLRVSITRRRPF